MQEVVLYCKRCRKSLKMKYVPTGNGATPMFINVCVVCHHCKRTLRFKQYTEEMLIQNSVDGKLCVQPF